MSYMASTGDEADARAFSSRSASATRGRARAAPPRGSRRFIYPIPVIVTAGL